MNNSFVVIAVAIATLLSCAYAQNEQCGRLSPESDLDSGSDSTDLPWHGAVYMKTTTPYQFRCAVTLVTKNAVLSAGHCFWDGIKQSPLKAEDFVVAFGKTHRPWDASEDQHAQKSDIAEIKLPPHFRGAVTNYQDDLAVLVMAKDITFNLYVRPVCLDFEQAFERQQLKENSPGKVASWGGVKPSKTYKIIEMIYISIEQCFSDSPTDFREYITSDKICTGFKNGTGLCRGDGGASLSFPSMEVGKTRYYLRGIVSTAPISHVKEDGCTDNSLYAYTQISKHELFIKENIAF